jgi:hypothetical protein
METLKPRARPLDALPRLELEDGETVRSEGLGCRMMWGYFSEGVVTLTDRRVVFRARTAKFGNLERWMREVRLTSITELRVTGPGFLERGLLRFAYGVQDDLRKVVVKAHDGTLEDFFAKRTLAESLAQTVAATHASK